MVVYCKLVNSVAAYSSIRSGENLGTRAANITLDHHRLFQTNQYRQFTFDTELAGLDDVNKVGHEKPSDLLK